MTINPIGIVLALGGIYSLLRGDTGWGAAMIALAFVLGVLDKFTTASERAKELEKRIETIELQLSEIHDRLLGSGN